MSLGYALLLLVPLASFGANSPDTAHCACNNTADIGVKKVENPDTPEGFQFVGAINGEDVVTKKSAETQISHAERATVIVFLSAKCPCSASHEAVIKRLFLEYSFHGIQFVGIHSNIDEPYDVTRTHFEQTALPFSVIQDRSNQFADTFSALKTPHVFVLNPKGVPLYQGGIDDSHNEGEANKHYLKDALDEIASGKEPSRKMARTLGCMIKR